MFCFLIESHITNVTSIRLGTDRNSYITPAVTGRPAKLWVCSGNKI